MWTRQNQLFRLIFFPFLIDSISEKCMNQNEFKFNYFCVIDHGCLCNHIMHVV